LLDLGLWWYRWAMGSLRFLLALSVAGIHAASMFGFSVEYWILSSNRAVQIFYMISGFLIAMILNGKYADTPRGNWIFYTNRIVKIFAPYLVILSATVAICLISKMATGNALLLNEWFAEAARMSPTTWTFAVLTNIFIVGQEWAFLLIYRAGSLFYDFHAYNHPPIASQFTVIVPAWTLSLELLFYALAPFILRRHILLIAALAFASYQFRMSAYGLGYFGAVTEYRFFPFELSLFLYGALCFHVGRLFPPLKARWVVALTLTIIVVIFVPDNLVKREHQLYALVGLTLPALYAFSVCYAWDRSLGELSYPLYLVHWPIGAFAVMTARPGAGTAPFYPMLVIVASTVVAVLVNRYVAEPLDKGRQARAKDSNAVKQSPPLGTPAAVK
jgi:peptidoglycan/LPS O-acetylase OafA/YrhL